MMLSGHKSPNSCLVILEILIQMRFSSGPLHLWWIVAGFEGVCWPGEAPGGFGEALGGSQEAPGRFWEPPGGSSRKVPGAATCNEGDQRLRGMSVA